MLSLFRKKPKPVGANPNNKQKTERDFLNEKCLTNDVNYVLYISNKNTNFVVIEKCSSGNGVKKYRRVFYLRTL